MTNDKSTKLTRKERQMVELLCRLARNARQELKDKDSVKQSLFEAEYEVREHWRLAR